MSDFMSKLPNFKELTSMTGKFVNGLKTTVCEIVEDYKKNHPTEVKETKVEEKKAEVKEAEVKVEEKKAEVKEAEEKVEEKKSDVKKSD